jgi:hypothetical protein
MEKTQDDTSKCEPTNKSGMDRSGFGNDFYQCSERTKPAKYPGDLIH